jgi:K+-sensing histidine kinase KdpD
VLGHAKAELEVWQTTWRVASKCIDKLGDLQHYDVGDLVSDVVNDFKTQERDAVVDFSGVPKGTTCVTNKQVIASCLHELLYNAWKHRDKSKPDPILVGVNFSGSALEILIQNEGAIPEEAQDRIFELFYRLEKHAQNSGTGLGLWRVRTLLKAHPGASVAVKRREPVIMGIHLPVPSQEPL